MAKFEDRDLPAPFGRGHCGHCGQVESEIVHENQTRKVYVWCNVDAGNCQQTGGCKCYLFAHKKDVRGAPLQPWDKIAESGKANKKEKDSVYVQYRCICVTGG